MKIRTIVKPDNANTITLPVSVMDTVISVAPGNFRMLDKHYTLEEPYTYKISMKGDFQWIGFYLMKGKKDNKIVVMVDEVLGTELPLNMNEDPDYTMLWQIASVVVPAGAHVQDLHEGRFSVDLENMSLQIIHSDVDAKKPKDEEHPLYRQRVS